MLITVIVFCEKLEQMDDNVDQTLIIGVLSKLLPFLVNDKGEKSYGDREKLTDTKEKWRETRAVYFLSDNRFVRASITRRRNSTSVCEIGLTDFSVRNSNTGRAKARPIQIGKGKTIHFYFSQLFWIMSRRRKEMKIIFLISDDFVGRSLLDFCVDFSIFCTLCSVIFIQNVIGGSSQSVNLGTKRICFSKTFF